MPPARDGIVALREGEEGDLVPPHLSRLSVVAEDGAGAGGLVPVLVLLLGGLGGAMLGVAGNLAGVVTGVGGVMLTLRDVVMGLTGVSVALGIAVLSFVDLVLGFVDAALCDLTGVEEGLEDVVL